MHIRVRGGLSKNNVQPVIVTSLVHSFDLPKNHLINPFYDLEIETLRGHNNAVINRRRRRLSMGSIDMNDTDVSDLTERSTIDSAWENLMVSGPTAVNLLAQVMVLSSKLDFSLREANPNYIYQYVKYPDSFRMTLTQISDEGWQAFLIAHINMDKLQLNMQQIPNHVKVALKVLTETQTPKFLEIQLSKTLNNIRRIGNDCITVANETHVAFSNVMNHLGEVIALTEVSRGLGETRLRETEIQLNVSQEWKTELKQLHTLLKEHYENSEEDLRFAHIQYSRALARRPSRFEKVLVRIADAVLKLTSNAVKAVNRFVSHTKASGSAPSGLDHLVSGSIIPTTENGKALLMAQSLSESVKDLIDIFSEMFYSTNNQTSNRGLQEMENILQEMNTYAQLIGDTDIAANIIKPLIARAKTLSTRAIQLARDDGIGRKVSRNETDDLLSELNQLVRDTKKIDAAAGLIDDSSRPKSLNDGGYSSDSSKMIIQITERKLQDARNRTAMSLTQLRKNMNEMNELVGKIASLDITRINYAQLLDVMRQALGLLGTMRQTWAQIVLLFSTIATEAEIVLAGTLNPFIEQSKLASTAGITLEERKFFVEILKDQSFTIHRTSYSLFLMSRTYVDMSNEFLMPRLSSLSQMLTAKDDVERMKLNQQLAAETRTTQEKVKALVEERKQMYSNMIENRNVKLKADLDRLGGPSRENQQAIEEASQLIQREMS